MFVVFISIVLRALSCDLKERRFRRKLIDLAQEVVQMEHGRMLSMYTRRTLLHPSQSRCTF